MPTIANTYGSTAHISPLLRKVRKLGLLTPNALLQLAVARGCGHYTPPDFKSEELRDPGSDQLGDLELAVALISGAQDYDPQLMRCAAQLLSAPHIKAAKLVRLAKMERCGPVLSYIAHHARQWDEGREAFWQEVSQRLPDQAGPVTSGVWPHPSRFMIQAGYRRGGGTSRPVWLRPRPVSP